MEFHGWKGKLREAVLIYFRALLYFFVRNGILYIEGYGLMTKTWMMLPPSTNLPFFDSDSSIEHSIFAAGCLICANVGKVHDQERLIVFNLLTGMFNLLTGMFNLLTGKFKELPRLVHRGNSVLMHVIVDSKLEESYKVIEAESSRLGAEVYDFRTDVWKVTEELSGPLFALNEHQSGVSVDGILYSVGFFEGDRGKCLLAYSIAKENWLSERTYPFPFQLFSTILLKLVESSGEMHLFSEQERGSAGGIDVQLDQILRQWENVTTDQTKVENLRLQEYPEYTCASFGKEKLCVFNTIASSGDSGGWQVYPGVVKSICRSLKMISNLVVSTAIFALTTPVAGALAPEPGTQDQRTVEAGKFEKSSNFAFGVIGGIACIFTIIGVGVAIIECRKRTRRTNGVLGGEALNVRAGRMLQTFAVRRFSISDIVHYEHVQRFEELV